MTPCLLCNGVNRHALDCPVGPICPKCEMRNAHKIHCPENPEPNITMTIYELRQLGFSVGGIVMLLNYENDDSCYFEPYSFSGNTDTNDYFIEDTRYGKIWLGS